MAKTRTFYVTFGEKGTPQCTLRLPARRVSQVSICLRLTLPDGIFDRVVPALAIDIPTAAVVAPTIEVVTPPATPKEEGAK